MDSKPAGRKDNPLTRRSTYSHWAAERVRFSDTDMLGHVNNAIFGVYFEIGRTEYIMRHAGEEKGIVLVMARLAIDFLQELHWPAKVEIGTGILAIGRTSVTIGQGLFDGERCVASAEAVGVAIDVENRVPRVIPDSMRERLSQMLLRGYA